MMRVGLVHNPRARRNRVDPGLAGHLERLAPDGVIRVAPPDLEALDRAMAQLRDAGVELICVNGGDGTLHRCVGAAVAAWGPELPAFLPLCGGTMNTVARGAGVRGRPRRLLAALTDALATGRPLATQTRWLLQLTTHEGPRYGFLFGNGLIANYLELYYAGDRPGPVRAAWVLARLVASALVRGPYAQAATRRFVGAAHLDEQRSWQTHGWLAIGGGTVPGVGLGFEPFRGALEEPGALHLVGVGCPPLGFVPELARIQLARPLAHPANREAHCQAVRIESPEPFGFMLDGDLYEADGRLDVRVHARVRFVLPLAAPAPISEPCMAADP